MAKLKLDQSSPWSYYDNISSLNPNLWVRDYCYSIRVARIFFLQEISLCCRNYLFVTIFFSGILLLFLSKESVSFDFAIGVKRHEEVHPEHEETGAKSQAQRSIPKWAEVNTKKHASRSKHKEAHMKHKKNQALVRFYFVSFGKLQFKLNLSGLLGLLDHLD